MRPPGRMSLRQEARCYRRKVSDVDRRKATLTNTPSQNYITLIVQVDIIVVCLFCFFLSIDAACCLECEECETRPAEVKCNKCDCVYCKACFEVVSWRDRWLARWVGGFWRRTLGRSYREGVWLCEERVLVLGGKEEKGSLLF